MTAYAESKVRSEAALSQLADDSFSPVSMRSATAYGASPRLRLDVVLNNLAGWAFTTGRIRILSDGTPWRPVVHVQDIARAIVALLDAPRELVHDQAFDVGVDGENYEVRELAEIVREAIPDCEIEYEGGGGPDPRSYRVDFGKLARLLPGPDARVDCEGRGSRTGRCPQTAGMTFQQFEGDRYVRLKRLTSCSRTVRSTIIRGGEGGRAMQSYDATLNQDVMQRVTSLPSCRFCGSSLRHTLHRLRNVPAVRKLPEARAARGHGTLLPAARSRV